ncbi:uncharacterized protein LOC141898140 [Tubulanus polymorphus]|uniref:uncharacterized protein LOC141898140 n=1 Tax=Tubulanus polymorphus TaxID=672921 RepID=UPI003DA61399
MVDFQTQTRLHGLGYRHTPAKRAPLLREIHRDHKWISPERRTLAHNCRHPVMQDHEDRRIWEASLFADGLRKTCESFDKMHIKEARKPDKKQPDKLLFNVGFRGSSKGNFYYPRGLAINSTGDIHIADAKNHRLQIFNSHGVLKQVIGKRGKSPREFHEPSGVGIMPNDDIVVADTKNKRVQVFDVEGKYKFLFNVTEEPFDVACDSFYNVAISTFDGSVELYRRGGKLFNRFSVSANKNPVYLTVNDKGEILTSDPYEQMVKYFNHRGEVIYKFQPVANADGLSFFNAGLCVNPLGQVIVADCVNHTVNLFSERGQLLLQLAGPTDDVGAAQTCMIGPEGHLVVTEYTSNGNHCLKIFRYRDCECHPHRPSSSKRATPIP